MKLYNIAFTGPRNERPEDLPYIHRGIGRLRNRGMGELLAFHTGGASGFDTRIFKGLVYHPDATSVLHVPFGYQREALLGGGEFDHVDFAECPICPSGLNRPRDRNDNYLYQKRNEHMVDSAQLLVYYNPWKKGGTQNCINYAKTTGIEMVNILDL